MFGNSFRDAMRKDGFELCGMVMPVIADMFPFLLPVAPNPGIGGALSFS
jgi:hypothetical protein